MKLLPGNIFYEVNRKNIFSHFLSISLWLTDSMNEWLTNCVYFRIFFSRKFFIKNIKLTIAKFSVPRGLDWKLSWAPPYLYFSEKSDDNIAAWSQSGRTTRSPCWSSSGPLTGEWREWWVTLTQHSLQAHIWSSLQVRDGKTGEGIAGATVHVRNITRVDRHVRMEADINHDVTSARAGDYWRLLTDGEYEVTPCALIVLSEVKWMSFQIIVQAEGYDSQAKLVQVSNEGHDEGRATFPWFWMQNIFPIFSYKTGFRPDAPHWIARGKSDERIRGLDVTRTLWGDQRDYLLFEDCNQILLLGPEDWRLSRLIQTIKVSSNIQIYV